MKLIFRERRRKKTNRESLEKVINSMLKHFLTDEDLKDVSLEVLLMKFHNDSEQDSYIQPYGKLPFSKFTICLNNSNKIWKIKQCLRHELIHLKQIFKEELECWGDEYTYWLGKKVDPNVNYWNLPWEIEAYELENTRF